MRHAAPINAAVLAAVLCLVALPAAAQKGAMPLPADAGWSERDYLLHYAAVVCLQGAYGTLAPPPAAALDALAQEAWAMVEHTRRKPEAYNAIHTLATVQGRKEAPAQAVAGCSAWAKRNAAEIMRLAAVSQ